MADLNINVKANTTNAQQNISALGGTLDKASKPAGMLGMSFTDLKSALDLAAGAAKATGQVLKQAFDFGELGAQVTQTSESFDLLIEKVGATPTLLDDLRAAAGGTISDLKLASATSNLLAGAQGELATSLANATPKLLEIARAANKLNPSLGDTAFLYDSLATGIKRASPMILDNLGLTIKVGEANQKYADQLGKTVAELTVTEQKQALLNATLEAGDVLINQVGGSVESATDQYNTFKTSIENTKNALAETANSMIDLQAVTRKIDVFQNYLDVSNQIEAAYEAGNITLAERNKLIFQHDYLMQDSTKTMNDLESAAQDLNAGYTGLNTQAREYLPVATANTTATAEWASASLDAAQKEYMLQDATLKAKEEMIKAEEAARNIASAFSGVGLAASQAAAMTIMLQIASGEMSSEAGQAALNMLALKEAVANGEVSMGDYIAAMRDGILTQDEYNKLLGTTTSAQEGATGALDDAEAAMLNQKQGVEDSAEAIANLNEMAQNAATDLAGMGDSANKAVDLIDPLHQSLVNLDESLGQDYTIDLPSDSVDDFYESVVLAKGATDDLKKAAQAAAGTYDINFQIHTTGSIPTVGGGLQNQGNNGQGGTTATAKAIGGPVFAGNPYLVGEQGPELFIPNQSGSIATNSQTQNLLSGGAGSMQVINLVVDGKVLASVVAPYMGQQVRLNKQSGYGYTGR